MSRADDIFDFGVRAVILGVVGLFCVGVYNNARKDSPVYLEGRVIEEIHASFPEPYQVAVEEQNSGRRVNLILPSGIDPILSAGDRIRVDLSCAYPSEQGSFVYEVTLGGIESIIHKK